jgi:hypothetical protein
MSKLTYLIVMSMLILWLAGSGCVGNDTDSQDTGLTPNSPGTDSGENPSAGQQLTEAEIHEFDKNVTDLQDILENSSEEIIVEEI